MGLNADLDVAAQLAVSEMVDFLVREKKMDRDDAYILCSVACDLKIHEVVDVPNWVAGMFLPETIVEGRS